MGMKRMKCPECNLELEVTGHCGCCNNDECSMTIVWMNNIKGKHQV